jgi:hypothetical protein
MSRTTLALTAAALLALVASPAAAQQEKGAGGRGMAEAIERAATETAAQTYEHLAEAIIAIEKTEDDLVKSILIGHFTSAEARLRMAMREGETRRPALERAAEEIANIANEGDKRIQAVRQRLLKAGHTHNTDVETKEDYMFINGKEKKALLALAQRVGAMKDDVAADDLRAAARELAETFQKAMQPE